MTTATEPTYIRDLDELPGGCRLRLYGAGGRGDEVLTALRAGRPDITVLEFLDTFKSGERQGLAVRTLEMFLRTREPGDDALLLIASTFYPSILENLERAGLGGAYVLLKDADPPFVTGLPEDRVAQALADGTHPLRRPPRNTRARDDRIWRCADFSSVYFRPTGLSFCCWLPDLARIGEDVPAAIGRLQRLRGQFRQATDANRHPFCAACPSLVPGHDAAEAPSDRIRTLHLDISLTCNLDCVYCIVKNFVHALDYDFEAALDRILASDLLVPDFRFTWGGLGEPTINPLFTPVTEALIARGGSGLVYSNCVKYSNVIEKNLAERLQVVCSLDAGTPETYAALRGRDRFHTVWDNIARYIAAAGPALFTAKYIVLPENCGETEIDGFVAACVRAGVKNVLLARDFYKPTLPDAVVCGLGRLYRASRDAGLHPAFLDSAVSPAEQRQALAWADMAEA